MSMLAPAPCICPLNSFVTPFRTSFGVYWPCRQIDCRKEYLLLRTESYGRGISMKTVASEESRASAPLGLRESATCGWVCSAQWRSSDMASEVRTALNAIQQSVMVEYRKLRYSRYQPMSADASRCQPIHNVMAEHSRQGIVERARRSNLTCTQSSEHCKRWEQPLRHFHSRQQHALSSRSVLLNRCRPIKRVIGAAQQNSRMHGQVDPRTLSFSRSPAT